jgi:hypothetical protein
MVPVPFEKFMVVHLLRNFATIYRIQMLITGRQEAQEAGETRPYISLYLSKIWVDVVVLPTPDLSEEQSVDNTVFANQFSFFFNFR